MDRRSLLDPIGPSVTRDRNPTPKRTPNIGAAGSQRGPRDYIGALHQSLGTLSPLDFSGVASPAFQPASTGRMLPHGWNPKDFMWNRPIVTSPGAADVHSVLDVNRLADLPQEMHSRDAMSKRPLLPDPPSSSMPPPPPKAPSRDARVDLPKGPPEAPKIEDLQSSPDPVLGNIDLNGHDNGLASDKDIWKEGFVPREAVHSLHARINELEKLQKQFLPPWLNMARLSFAMTAWLAIANLRRTPANCLYVQNSKPF